MSYSRLPPCFVVLGFLQKCVHCSSSSLLVYKKIQSRDNAIRAVALEGEEDPKYFGAWTLQMVTTCDGHHGLRTPGRKSNLTNAQFPGLTTSIRRIGPIILNPEIWFPPYFSLPQSWSSFVFTKYICDVFREPHMCNLHISERDPYSVPSPELAMATTFISSTLLAAWSQDGVGFLVERFQRKLQIWKIER